MTKLKPCPFCGGEPSTSFGSVPMSFSGYYYSIFCEKCGIEVEKRIDAFMIGKERAKEQLEKQVETLWNTRNGGNNEKL